MTSSRVPANLTRVSLFRFQSLNIGYSQVYTRCALRHYRPVNLELTLFYGLQNRDVIRSARTTGHRPTINNQSLPNDRPTKPSTGIGSASQSTSSRVLSVLSDYSVVLSVSKWSSAKIRGIILYSPETEEYQSLHDNGNSYRPLIF